MPRAHLSKRLDDATAIQLFAEHHIVHVRRRKNGEIVAVKHSTFGWMSPEQYYGLQKMHDLMPILQEFIRGGYQAKAWLWGANFSITILDVSVPVPFGASLMFTETLNLYEELVRTPKNPAMLLLRAYALLGPFGDIIQIIDFMNSLLGIPSAVVEGFAAGAGTIFPFLSNPAKSECEAAYQNLQFWRKKELAFEAANQAENVELVASATEWFNRGVTLGCDWAKVGSWRLVT